jgi:hypothetical protein
MVHFEVASVVIADVGVPAVAAEVVLVLEWHRIRVVVSGVLTGLTTEILVLSHGPNRLTITEFHSFIENNITVIYLNKIK